MHKRVVVVLMVFVLLIGMLPAAAQSDMAQTNKDRVRAAIAEFNAGNPAAFYALYAEQYVMNQGGVTQEPMARADVEAYAGALLAAMPDLQIEPAALIAQGDQVAAELVFSGTFTQPFSFPPISSDSFPPTNEPVQWTELEILHFDEAGQVDAEWALSDPMVMFAQLGVIPAQDGDVTGTALETPAGYQALSADELAATFTSGNAARNQQRLEDEIAVDLGGDTSAFYAEPFVAWNNSAPFSVTASDEQGDAAFLDMVKQAMPDASTDLVTVVAEGDWVAAVVVISGTFTEDVDFFGTPLSHTGEPIAWMLGAVNRYDAEGKVVEQWIEGDATPLLQGLGLMPAFGE